MYAILSEHKDDTAEQYLRLSWVCLIGLDTAGISEVQKIRSLCSSLVRELG